MDKQEKNGKMQVSQMSMLNKLGSFGKNSNVGVSRYLISVFHKPDLKKLANKLHKLEEKLHS